jgi:hypothetical protein
MQVLLDSRLVYCTVASLSILGVLLQPKGVLSRWNRRLIGSLDRGLDLVLFMHILAPVSEVVFEWYYLFACISDF